MTNKPKDYYVGKSPEGSPTLISLYKKPKPEYGLFESDSEYYPRLDKHLASRFAYLRELEWKVLDRVYDISTGNYVGDVVEIENGWIYTTRARYLIQDVTHYRPGFPVPVSEVSFVREVKEYLVTNDHEHTEEENKQLTYSDRAEAEMMLSIFEQDLGKDTHWIEEIVEWQPSPEPEKWIITSADVEDGATPNPLHAFWLSEIEEGIIQANVNQI